MFQENWMLMDGNNCTPTIANAQATSPTSCFRITGHRLEVKVDTQIKFLDLKPKKLRPKSCSIRETEFLKYSL